MKTQRQQLNLLNETVAFYSEDTSRRGLDGDTCAYITPDSKKCAVGRHILKSAINLVDNGTCASGIVTDRKGLDSILKTKYRGFSENLWDEIQAIHDAHENWNKSKGLTQYGKDNVAELQSKIKRGDYNI